MAAEARAPQQQKPSNADEPDINYLVWKAFKTTAVNLTHSLLNLSRTTRTVEHVSDKCLSWWTFSSFSGLLFFWSPSFRSCSCWNYQQRQQTAERHLWPLVPACVGRTDQPCPCTYTASACQLGPQHTATSKRSQKEMSGKTNLKLNLEKPLLRKSWTSSTCPGCWHEVWYSALWHRSFTRWYFGRKFSSWDTSFPSALLCRGFLKEQEKMCATTKATVKEDIKGQCPEWEQPKVNQ